MNVGIPGTGIGGLFYITAALFAPFRRHRNGPGGFLRPFMIAVGVMVGIFATGWLLGFMFGPATHSSWSPKTGAFARQETVNLVRWASLLASVILLAAVLTAVQIARLFQKRNREHDTT